jgi:electron transfer flavoprotein-quinone oxidoreductase
MADDKFDVIIVGAGVAGSTAACQLARQGLEVVLIERGPYPGSKNLSGGVLYGRVLEQLFPNYWETAPIERCISNQVISFLTADAHFNIDFKTQALQRRHNAYTVLRARFDRWLADQAEAAGAMLVPGIKIDQVIMEGSRVVGVVAGDEQMRADVVIAADGATSFITQAAGLRPKPPAEHSAIGVKQVIGLPRELIEDRFHLSGDEGAAYAIVGWATQGISGGGFLYTNIDSLSVGLVLKVDDLVRHKARSGDLLETFLQHPMIAPLIQGGKLLEYGAHLIPEGGFRNMPPRHTGGMLVVGDAAGFGINNGFVVRGMDLAIGSALAAAETVIEAKAQNDFSAEALAGYERRLAQSYMLADMRTYQRTPDFFENPRLYSDYPGMLESFMTGMYAEDAVPKQHALPLLMRSLKESGISIFDLVKDALDGARAL